MTDPYVFNKKLYPTINDAQRARIKHLWELVLRRPLQVPPIGSKGFYSPFDGRWVDPREIMGAEEKPV
jgi:hypothetical protein